MKPTSVARQVLAGIAGLAVGTLGALALTAPAQAQGTETPSSVEFENTCDGTLVTITSGTELDQYQWVVADNGPQGGAAVEELASGESTTVFAPKSWASISVFYTALPVDGVTGPSLETWPDWIWEAPADCPPPGDQLPPELGEWSFDCDTVEITFVNPFDTTETFSFEPSTGEPKQVEIVGDDSATVEFPSSEGLTVEIRLVEQGTPGVLLADPLELRSELWDELGCDDDQTPPSGEGADEDGEGGELPVTGSRTGFFALGAVALLAAGGGLLLLVRRRRTTFTA